MGWGAYTDEPSQACVADRLQDVMMDLERTPRDVGMLLQEAGPRLAELCRAFGVRLLVVFGSLAAGEAHATSDIDLGVDFGEDIGPQSELRFLGEVVSAVGTDRLDLANLRHASPLLLREVALHGLPLYEAAPGVFAAFRLAALGRYMDTARFRRLRSDLLRSAARP